MKIDVHGLGKLGLPYALSLQAAGHDVAGFDIDQRSVRVATGATPAWAEPGLDAFQPINCPSRADRGRSDIGLIVVPSPSLPDGSFDAGCVYRAALTTDADVLVVVTTLSPGSTRLVEHPRVVYSPSFIALGSVLHDIAHPDVALIGEGRTSDGDVWLKAIRDVWQKTPRVVRCSWASAEIAKVATNAYVTMKISFANAIAGTCDFYDGAHVEEVLAAVGGDSRIGEKYLKAGPPYGGPCFPRDTRAFDVASYGWGKLANATEHINEMTLQRTADRVTRLGGSKVAVLGLGYKPRAFSAEMSPGSRLYDLLDGRKNLKVVAFDRDPAVASQVKRALSRFVEVERFAPEVVACCMPDHRELAAKLHVPVVDLWR